MDNVEGKVEGRVGGSAIARGAAEMSNEPSSHTPSLPGAPNVSAQLPMKPAADSEWRAGDRAAFNQLMPLVYDGLHRLASRYLRGERAGHTFRPTELISELYLKMVGSAQFEWNDRIHFFAIASRGMRQILVDYAHKRCADKRGGGDQPLTFDEGLVGTDRPHELIALDGALEELVKFDERKARAVELHYFGGLNQDEVAAVLGVHVNTVARDLRLAEAWIHRHLRPES